jgi:hypothetical protein
MEERMRAIKDDDILVAGTVSQQNRGRILKPFQCGERTQNNQFFLLGMCKEGQALSIRGYGQRNEEMSQLELIHVISSI